MTYFKDQERIDSCGHCDICAPESSAMIISQAPLKQAPAKSARKKQISVQARMMNDEQRQRLEKIKQWRKDFAKSNDMPAFLVFSNKTLDELAVKNPQTLSQLEHIYGLGPHKIESFGNILLQQLTEIKA
ncbi:MAG: HRDC domain-containing protein [Bdellovibrionota bacterium]